MAAAQFNQTGLARIERYFEDYVAEGKIAGCSMAAKCPPRGISVN